MDCQALRDDLMDVLYGEADDSARRRVVEHQRACSACREELASLRRVRQDLAAWELPPEVAGRSRWPGWLPLAAGLLVAAGGLAAGQMQAASLGKRVARLEAERRAGERAEPTAALVSLDRLVAESEDRQRHRFAADLASLEARYEARRRYDLAQVSAGLSYLEGQTGLQMARTTELMGHVLQAAQQR